MLLVLALALIVNVQQSAPPPEKPAKPLGTFDDPGAGPPRSLQSVGVRGAIDSGGYGASAEVKGQTEFYEQLADMQVDALRIAWQPQNPCDAANSSRVPAIRLLARGEFQAASASLEVLLRSDDRPTTRELLGLAYEGSGQLEAAAEQFRLAATKQPAAAANIAYGVALLFLGEVDQAEAAFHRALERGGEETALANLGVGAAEFQHGHIQEALAQFLDVATGRPLDNTAFGFIAISLRSADAGSLSHAISVLKSLTRRSPQDAGPPYALACALMAASAGMPGLAQADEMERHLKDAIRLEPQLADAHFRLAELYAAREDLLSAISEFRSTLDHNEQVVEAHYRLSQLYGRTGQPDRAKAELALYQQLRARRKDEIGRGIIRLRFPEAKMPSCPGH